MRLVFNILLIMCSLNIHSDLCASDSWVRLNSPTPATLRNCIFTDALNGWAAGDSGVIVHTSNGGNTFVIQNTTIDYYINDIFFINKRAGWAVANKALFEGSTILKTTNGGNVWSVSDFPDSTKIFRTVYFTDSLNGYLGGFGGAIYKTTDAGNSWIAATVDTSEFSGFPITKFKFASANAGFACGGFMDVAGVIWSSTNAGESWKAENYSPEPFYSFYVKDLQRILAVGGDFEYGVQICRTTNAGLNWNYQSLEMFGQAYSIDFRNGKEAWMALGYARSLAVSYDSGMSWSAVPAIDSAEIYSIDFVDSLNGWATGLGGVILKYNPLTNVNTPANLNLPSSVFLYQNYPNPFNPKTIINIQCSMFNFIILKVYDVLGNEVATLLNEKKSPGSYEVEFDGNNFPGGIYFYKLTAGDFSVTKKMVLVK